MGRVCSLIVGVKNHSVVSYSLWPPRLYSPWNSPGQNTGVGSLSLLQGIFPTQGSNPGLLHCSQILYHLSHRKPRNTGVDSLSLLQEIFPTQELSGVSCIAGGFFTSWAISGKPMVGGVEALSFWPGYEVDGVEHSRWWRSRWVFLCWSCHWGVCSVVSPETYCVSSRSTLLLALSSSLFQLWECWLSALVSLRHCVYKTTGGYAPA